jgi:hypothetical protein
MSNIDLSGWQGTDIVTCLILLVPCIFMCIVILCVNINQGYL